MYENIQDCEMIVSNEIVMKILQYQQFRITFHLSLKDIKNI